MGGQTNIALPPASMTESEMLNYLASYYFWNFVMSFANAIFLAQGTYILQTVACTIPAGKQIINVEGGCMWSAGSFKNFLMYTVNNYAIYYLEQVGYMVFGLPMAIFMIIGLIGDKAYQFLISTGYFS